MASEECWKMDLYGSLTFSTNIQKTPSKVSCPCFQGVPLTLDIQTNTSWGERCLMGMFLGSSHTEPRRCHWMSRVLFSGSFISCLLTPFLPVFFPYKRWTGKHKLHDATGPQGHQLRSDTSCECNVNYPRQKKTCSESIICLLITFPKEVGLRTCFCFLLRFLLL